MAAGVPVVDFTRPRHQVVAEIGAALEAWGFVAIVGHGIDSALLDRSYALAAEVFALPDAVKRRYETPEDGRQRGYTSFGVEHAKGQRTADLKEFWHIGRELPPGHPDRGGNPVNRPPVEVPAFGEVTGELFLQTERFAGQLASVIGEHLGFGADWLRPHLVNGNSVLRVIHYPPVEGAPPGAVRAAQHEDINLLTVLPVSTAPGLELLTRDGEWLPVIPPAGAVLCDTGDMMQRASGGRLPATTHRVVNPEGGSRDSRYSLPFFLHPRPEMRLAPPGQPGGTAGDYLRERLAETGVAAPTF